MHRFYQQIRPFVIDELDSAQHAETQGDATQSFAHLERAHVLGQRSTRLHILVHWKMLRWGLRRRQCREVFGQLWRLIGAAATTYFGLLPAGNTGGSNVNGFKVMTVPADLQARIDSARRNGEAVRVSHLSSNH